MKEVTTKEMANFILANVNLLDVYDLRETYTRTIRQKIKNEYGVYMEDSEINYSQTFEENWRNFLNKKILPKFGDIETFKFYQKVHYYGGKIYGFEGDTIQSSGMTVYELVYLLLYIVFNELDSDLARANEIEKKSGLRYDIPYYGWTNFETFGDVQVKKIKSGKITFKGLTPEMKERLEKVIKISKIRP